MHGGNPSLLDLRLRTLSSGHRDALFPAGSISQEKISLATGFALLFKAACATDAFTIVASLDCGIFVALFCCLFMFMLTQASFYVFTRTWSFGLAYSYEEIWLLVVGRSGAWIPKLCLLVAYISCTLYGFWEITYYIPNILLSIWPNTPEILLNPWFLQYIFLIPLALPSLVWSRVGNFGWAAWLSLLAYVVSLVSMVVHFFRTQWSEGFVSAADVVYVRWDFDADFQMLTDYNTAFFAHSFVAVIAQEMDRPTRQRTMGMTWISFTVTAILCYLVPLVGYLLFSDVEYLDNVLYYLNPENPEVIVAKIAVLVISLVSTAFFGYHMAGIVSEMLLPGTGAYGFSAFSGNIVLGLIAIWMNSLEDKFENLFYDLGTVAFAVLGFVLPPLTYLWQFQYRYLSWGLVATFVLVLGLAILITSIVWIVAGMLEEW